MTEASESRGYVARWLQQVPEFAKELGIRDPKRLKWLGSGGRADVVYIGERDGVKQVLKVTNDSAQAALSMAACVDRPMGIVPIVDVVETDVVPRVEMADHGERFTQKLRGLPELPRKGEEPTYAARTWGIVEKFVVPLGSLRSLGMPVAGEDPDVLIRRYAAAWRAYDTKQRPSDPLVEEWRMLYAAAIEWVEEVCEEVGSSPLLDLHEDNWGVDPDTGDLLLIDLGQCYTI